MIAPPRRFPLGVWPTPLERGDRIAEVFGTGSLLVKRDDLAGFAVAGNKTRPLEFLVGAALADGVEVLVTGGGAGSNFCPATAIAARMAGLDCTIVMWGEPAGPNVALARAAGATIVPTGRNDRAEVDTVATRLAAELTASGRRALAVPRGGSTPVGALGFFVAASEVAGQLGGLPSPRAGGGSVGSARAAGEPSPSPWAAGESSPRPAGESPPSPQEAREAREAVGGTARPSAIVFPVGSGGCCAGLLAGLAAEGLDVPVVGVSVSRPPDVARETVLALAEQCARLRGTAPPRPEQLEIVDAVGAGFGRLTDRERQRARTAFARAGLLLDATYGAKTFTVAIDRAVAEPVLWWHTGGVLPAVAELSGAVATAATNPGERA